MVDCYPITVKTEMSLREIYDAYYRRMCFYAARFTTDMEEADDIVQDIFVTMWTRMMSFESSAALRSFLYTAVYRACINRIKSTDLHRRHETEMLRQYAVPEKDYVTSRIEDEVLWEVYNAIAELPAECRKVFKLSYMDGLDIQTVADILGISPHTVKSQRARAKQLLREKLKYLYLLTYFFPGNYLS